MKKVLCYVEFVVLEVISCLDGEVAVVKISPTVAPFFLKKHVDTSQVVLYANIETARYS